MRIILILLVCVESLDLLIYPYDSPTHPNSTNLIQSILSISQLSTPSTDTFILSSDEPSHYFTSATQGKSQLCSNLEACQHFLSLVPDGSSLNIKSSSSSNPATLYLYERQAQFNVDSAINLTFENLIISGMRWYDDQCNEAYCSHCHSSDSIKCDSNEDNCITQDGFIIENLANFMGKYGYDVSNDCMTMVFYKPDERSYFLSLNNKNANVLFRNLEFRDIRMPLDGLLSVTDGNLTLNNVNFTSVQPLSINPIALNNISGIITTGLIGIGINKIFSSNIIYDTGTVSRMNSSYLSKYSSISMKSFIKVINLRMIVLKNIVFQENFYYDTHPNFNQSDMSYFLMIWDSYNIVIDSCKYSNNTTIDGILYINSMWSANEGQVIIKDSQMLDNISYNYTPMVKIATFNHVIIQNSKFIGNKLSLSPGIVAETAKLSISQSLLTSLLEGLRFTYLYGQDLGPALNIQDCEFRSNMSKDYAADVSIFGKSNQPLYMKISKSEFYETTSKHEGSIYIDSSVILPQSVYPALIELSTFENISLYNNKGTLSTYHSEGILIIYKTSFLSIISQDSSSFIAYLNHSPNAQRLDTSLPETYVLFKECTFKDNTGSYGVSSLSLNYDCDTITESCLFLNNTSTLIRSQMTHYYDIGSTFIYNTNTEYAIYSGISSSYASFTDSVIKNNEISDLGLVVAENSSYLDIRNVTFSNNIGGRVACSIYIGKLGHAHIEDSFFFNNTSRFGSALYLSSTSKGVVVNNTEFGYNYGGSVIYLLSSDLTMINSYMHDHFSREYAVGINSHVSTLSLYNVTIRNHVSPYACFLFLQGLSVAHVENSLFEDSESLIGGSVYSETSDVYIHNSMFRNIRGSQGALVLTLSMSSFSMSGSSIYNITTTSKSGDAILYFFFSKAIIISDSTIDRYNNQAIYVQDLYYFYINNTTISNGSAPGFTGGAVQLFRNKYPFSILDCTFKDIVSEYAAGIYINARQSEGSINNCRFENLSSKGSTAILSVDNRVNISDSQFVNNTAIIDEQVSHVSYHGRGGAIALICLEDECISSVSNCNFNRNRAKEGGAIYWYNIEPTLLDNNFTENYAEYGLDIANYATGLMLFQSTPGKLSYAWSYLNTIAASGQLIPQFEIAVIDTYSQIVSTDNKSACSIIGINSTFISGEASYIAKNGIYTIDSLALIKEPGTTGIITILSSAYSVYDSAKFDVTILNILVNIRLCEIGETISEDNRCVICPSNTYSISDNSTYCDLCPKNAICKGGAEMYPYEKYWRSSNYSDHFFECLNPYSCIGHDNFTSMTGKCLEGYKGNLCQSCEKNWSRSVKNKCEKCPEETANAFRLLGTAICISIVLIFVIRKSILCADRPKEVHTIYIRNLTTYLQTISIVAMLNLAWPRYVKSFLTTQESYSDLTRQILSIDCLISSHDLKFDRIYLKVIIVTILPAILILLSILYWGTLRIYYNKPTYLRKELRITIIILLFMLNSTLLEDYLNLLICMEIDPGEYYLVEDLEHRCWVGNHEFFAYFFGIPGVIIWSIIIPNLGLFILMKNHKKLHSISMKTCYGFLYSGYKRETFYWEFVIQCRKILITFIVATYSSISINLQVLTASAVLIFAYICQMKYKPYITPELNSLEEKCILVSGITVYCGGYFLSPDLHDSTKIILFVIMIAANAYYLAFWVSGAIQSLVLNFVKRHPRVFRKVFKIFPKFRYFLDGGSCNEINFERHLRTLQNRTTRRQYIRTVSTIGDIQDTFRSRSSGLRALQSLHSAIDLYVLVASKVMFI